MLCGYGLYSRTRTHTHANVNGAEQFAPIRPLPSSASKFRNVNSYSSGACNAVAVVVAVSAVVVVFDVLHGCTDDDGSATTSQRARTRPSWPHVSVPGRGTRSRARANTRTHTHTCQREYAHACLCVGLRNRRWRNRPSSPAQPSPAKPKQALAEVTEPVARA